MLPTKGLAMRPSNRHQRPDDLIAAAELATFVYCPEQWRLQYGQGLAPENRAALDAGTRHHARQAVAERIAGVSSAIGRLLMALAAVALILWLWWRS
jgi:hypothetical protein